MKNTLISLFIFLFFPAINSHAQGEFWGTTYLGGQSNLGVIYKTDANGNNQLVKKEFLTMFPGSGRQIKLCQATLTTGKLYGVGGGGPNEKGIIYEFNQITNEYLKKVDLDGSVPFRQSLIQAPNGKLYGMTYDGGINNLGTLFEYDPVSNSYVKRIDFNGTNGKSPTSGLTLGASGKLYGLAEGGAFNNYGVLFEYDPITNIFTKKIDFDGTAGKAPFNGINQAANGKLYGYAFGAIFEYDPLSNILLKKVDESVIGGNISGSGLTQANNGKMYGVNSSNYLTSNSKGNIFEFDPITSSYVVKVEFDGANGNYPSSDLLLASNGKLYGTTNSGGIEDNGVLFEYEPGTSSPTKLFEFTVNTGTYPWGSLMQATNGKLYGITGNGGPGFGVLFEFDLTSNIYSRKIDFSASSDGNLPIYSPMQASNGKLYGYTYAGGENGRGTLYEYNLSSDSFIRRYDFNSSLSSPNGKLVEALSGFLFGSSGFGGINKKGAIFKFDINSNTVTTLFSFDGSNTGSFPNSLTVGANGKIYGTCGEGGANDLGTIFEFDPTSNAITKKIDLDFANGGRLQGALIQASNGKFYGLAGSGGSNGRGALLEYNPTLNSYSKLVNFDSNTGTYFPGELIEASSGVLYGFAGNDGTNGKGTLFEYNLITNVFTKRFYW